MFERWVIQMERDAKVRLSLQWLTFADQTDTHRRVDNMLIARLTPDSIGPARHGVHHITRCLVQQDQGVLGKL